MASCYYATLVGGQCGPNSYNPSIVECVTIKDCNKDILNHCSQYKISNDCGLSGSESMLLLARAGIFEIDESYMKMTGVLYIEICMAFAGAHKSLSVKAQCGLTTLLSSFIFNKTKILIPVGTGICRSCKEHLAHLATEWRTSNLVSTDDESSNCLELSTSLPQINAEQPEDSNTSTSDELVEEMDKLVLNETRWSIFSPDTASTTSSSSCDVTDVSSSLVARRKKLNEYLEACNIHPLKRPMSDWNQISERTQERYIQKTCEIVSSVLNDISSTNAPHLWKGLQTSGRMNKAFGLSHQPAEKAYLEALAEAYKTADSWDTRRQVLSTMSDVANFNVISEYIPVWKVLSSSVKDIASCESLDLTLKNIEQAIDECTFSSEEERDETLYLFTSAVRAINLWKGHQLRSVRQDQARLDVINLLKDEKTVYIVNDWAMKFLPHQYRESQSDWFGKKGISWHISVVGQLESQGFIHIIESCSQDSAAIVLIMQHVLNTLETENPKLKRAFFRQDNAGCYHSASTILACHHIAKTTGIKISRIDFSYPQGGKGSADRLAATCKCHIRLFVNEGNDVTNAGEMKNALLSHGGVEGVRVAVVPCIDDSFVAQLDKIPGISKLNNIEFKGRNIVTWRAYDVGKGKRISLSKIQDITFNWITVGFSSGNFKLVKSTAENTKRNQQPVTTEFEKAVQEEKAEDSESPIYSCPQEGCTRVFQRSSALEKHLSLESCTSILEKQTMLDVAKEKYASLLKEDVFAIPSISTSCSTVVADSYPVAQEGWALKESTKSYRFNEKQKSYLTSKFNIGQETGRKMKADVVSKEMRHARGEDGHRLFGVTEFLSVEQVSSFFSRMAAKVRQQKITITEADAAAAVEEDNFHKMRNKVLSSLQLQHPIVFDQYNVCDMVKSSTLKKLKVDMLQRLCEELNLDVPEMSGKKKNTKLPYIKLLESAVSGCSCNTG
ncbi:Retrovirus-related Pol poly from transposon 412 [Paramuricea clavata]|uniref:Retrovirus-related Pol poly from transposon 412, partial n=1 Tax=Paramuricea clavata TaxID=317549 RepID=A0A7D9J0S2_PARCT|nr:Retrovirus-related Pol poly from transposon 412 [Paramuricea clavata]